MDEVFSIVKKKPIETNDQIIAIRRSIAAKEKS